MPDEILQPPSNPAVEKEVVGMIMVADYDHAYEWVSEINVNMFFDSHTRKLFTYLKDRILNDGTMPDVTVTKAALPSINIAGFLANGGLSFRFDDAIRELRVLSMRRSLISVAHKFFETGHHPANNAGIDTINEIITTEVDNIVNSHTSAKRVRTIETLQSAVDRVKEAMVADKTSIKVPYCLPAIDEAMTLYRQQVHTIGAFQGTGKTALGLDCMRRQVAAGMKVVYFCTESSSDEIMLRILAAEMGVSIQVLIEGLGGQQRDFDLFKQKVIDIKKHVDNFWIYGSSDFDLRIANVGAICSKLAREHGQLDMTYLDFLQDLSGPEGESDERIIIGHNAKGYKNINVRLNSAGTAFSQFNQETHRQTRPTKRSFRGSGVISDVSHIMSVLFDEDGETGNPRKAVDLMYYSVKTRLIPQFARRLTFTGENGRFCRAHRYDESDTPPPQTPEHHQK